MTRDVFLLIVVVGSIFFILRKWWNSEKIHNNSIICFVGGLGAGKTFMGVHYLVKQYKRGMLYYRFRLRKTKPIVLSNIPILLSKGRKNKVWSHVLKREHLLLEERIPEGAYVFIDEFGEFASQYEFNNPNVTGELTTLVRFFRHYVNGRFIFTDQSLANVIYSVKRRTVIAYQLTNFRKSFLRTFTIDVDPLMVANGDVVSNVNILDRKRNQPYFYGFIPFTRHYDTRCYSENYKPDLPFCDSNLWGKYKCSYVIDLSVRENESEQYYGKKKSSNKTDADAWLNNYIKHMTSKGLKSWNVGYSQLAKYEGKKLYNLKSGTVATVRSGGLEYIDDTGEVKCFKIGEQWRYKIDM